MGCFDFCPSEPRHEGSTASPHFTQGSLSPIGDGSVFESRAGVEGIGAAPGPSSAFVGDAFGGACPQCGVCGAATSEVVVPDTDDLLQGFGVLGAALLGVAMPVATSAGGFAGLAMKCDPPPPHLCATHSSGSTPHSCVCVSIYKQGFRFKRCRGEGG